MEVNLNPNWDSTQWDVTRLACDVVRRTVTHPLSWEAISC
jgi:hypothetical protein